MNIARIDEIAARSGASAALHTAEVSREDKLIRHAQWLVRAEAEAGRKTGKTARDLASGAATRRKENPARRAAENRARAASHPKGK